MRRRPRRSLHDVANDAVAGPFPAWPAESAGFGKVRNLSFRSNRQWMRCVLDSTLYRRRDV